MTIKDNFSRRILAVSLGLAAVMLSASALVLSFNHATANPTPPAAATSLANTPNLLMDGATNYMMSYQAFVYDNGSNAYNVLVWNPTTGKSRIYYYDSGEEKMVHWTEGDLPAAPLN